MELLKLFEAGTMVTGTNCANCKFSNKNDKKKAEKADLDAQGGVKITDSKKVKLAQKADLITLPGNKKVTHLVKCGHPKVNQYITEHMCCAFWDAHGVIRSFKKTIDS